MTFSDSMFLSFTHSRDCSLSISSSQRYGSVISVSGFFWSQLNIEIQIIDCHLFKEEEDHDDVIDMLENELRIYQLSHLDNDNNVIKKRKDTYNMRELLESLEQCLEIDELFGEEEE